MLMNMRYINANSIHSSKARIQKSTPPLTPAVACCTSTAIFQHSTTLEFETGPGRSSGFLPGSMRAHAMSVANLRVGQRRKPTRHGCGRGPLAHGFGFAVVLGAPLWLTTGILADDDPKNNEPIQLQVLPGQPGKIRT